MTTTASSMHQRFPRSTTVPKPSTIQNSKNTRELPQTILMDVYHIIRDVTLFFCRRIIFGPTEFKLLVSFSIILIGSILKATNLAPNSYLSLKTNIFNRYFAKLGWAWTMGLLVPFIYLTCLTTYNQYQIFTRHLIRLAIATGIWYVITATFVRIEASTGLCTTANKQGLSRRVCLSQGHDWREGTDFSGHTFLLLYALLIINEEVKSYDQGTKKLKEASKTNSNVSHGDTTSTTVTQTRADIIAKIIRVLYVLLAALTILWEFMLLSTALYFHHTLHKLAAAFIAVFFWYITYYVWYQPADSSLLQPIKP